MVSPVLPSQVKGAGLRTLSRRGSWVRIPPPAPNYSCNIQVIRLHAMQIQLSDVNAYDKTSTLGHEILAKLLGHILMMQGVVLVWHASSGRVIIENSGVLRGQLRPLDVFRTAEDVLRELVARTRLLVAVEKTVSARRV